LGIVAVPRSPPRRRGPPAVAWIVLLAVLAGVAAALLSRPVGSLAPSSSSVGGLTVNQLTDVVLIVVVVFAGVWLFLSLRDGGSRLAIPSRVVVTILLVLLLGVIFVGLTHLVHIAPIPGSNTSSGSSSNDTGGFGDNNSSGAGLTGPFGTAGVTLPAWAGYVAIVAVALLIAVLLVPLLIARAQARRQALSGEGGPAPAARHALEDALQRLNSADGSDPRATILSLYARLLLLVGPRLRTVESLTPGEIKRDAIESLGLRPRVAQELTETFEEARYSTHVMTPEAVDLARAALSEAITDLASSAGVPA
jgi:hypothetical protein